MDGWERTSRLCEWGCSPHWWVQLSCALAQKNRVNVRETRRRSNPAHRSLRLVSDGNKTGSTSRRTLPIPFACLMLVGHERANRSTLGKDVRRIT
jgi:hypothetical protein